MADSDQQPDGVKASVQRGATVLANSRRGQHA
jgi:hypothetical protein